ncbi:hypothetical protein FN846DRAFT_782137 [Sphaerosporella brunnea]|uniref:Methyltransferase type 11 domain-containing protein n=1 Tax=Sphaerosporella brunnea TaxID=1250544 RepID=A0A5J5EQJ4_9PEZI|nr:hypothetical protein FN846DRAFT_782137 [Sphaerosporella brunnea]
MGPGKSPFEQAIARMEGSGLKMMLRRLSEDWGTARNDHNIEEVLFEQQLWSLMARQWLTQGKQLQSPAHEALLDDPHPEEEKRILNLHGSIADGWVLAAKYPDIMVYTLSADQDEPLVQNHNWAAPRNHHISCIPATDDFFPFPDNHFDVITSRRFASVVKSKSWLSVFQECHRCLKPRGWLEVQSLDAVPSRHGELLTAWLEARLIPGIEDSGLVAKSAKRVLDYMEIAGFGEIKTCKIALPVIAKASLSHEHQDKQDAVKLMVHTGRHYYQELYREFLRGGCSGSGGKSPWWWGNKTIREECERMGTLFGFLVSFGQKEF